MVSNSNAENSKDALFNFLERYNAPNIVKDKTCFKSLDNLSYIDLFITSQPQCFQNATVFSTGLSGFHKITVNNLKASFSKAPPKEMLQKQWLQKNNDYFNGYKNFEQDKFKYELKNRVQNESIECYSEFEKVFVDILNEHVPLKRSS